MATSNPLTLEKNICKQCEEYETSWKCENCNILGCNKCISDHFTKETPLGHMIVSIQDGGQLILKAEVESHCKTHPKEAFQRYCEMCDCLVCFECALSSHNQHTLCSIPEIVQKRRAEYEGILRDIEKSSVPALAEIIQNFKHGQEDYMKGIQDLVEKISNQAEKLKKEIDKVKDSFIKDLKEKQRLDLEMLKANQEKYEKKLAYIKCNVELCEAKLRSTHGIELLMSMEKMKDTLGECQRSVSAPAIVEPPPFFTAPTNDKDLQKIFGNLDIEREIERTSDDAEKIAGDSNVKVISKFEEEGPVTCIATYNNDAWILSSGNLNLTKKDGSKEKSFKINFDISDMAVSIFGELFVVDRCSKKVKKLHRNGEFVNWVDTSPFEPCGITVNPRGELMVTLAQDLSDTYNDEDSDCAVMVLLSKHGQILKICKGDSTSDFGFANEIYHPYHIAFNVQNGDMALSNWARSEEKYQLYGVQKISEDEAEPYKYEDETSLELDHPFSPLALAYSDEDLLVTDYFNSVIHTIDRDGSYDDFLMTEKDGLHRPAAIDVDKSGHVWIGCSTGTIFVVRINK